MYRSRIAVCRGLEIFCVRILLIDFMRMTESLFQNISADGAGLRSGFRRVGAGSVERRIDSLVTYGAFLRVIKHGGVPLVAADMTLREENNLGKIRYFSCRRRVIIELAAMTSVICNVAVFRAGRLDFFHELRLVSMTDRRFQHVSAHGTYLSGFLCRFRTGNVSRFVFSRVTYGAFVPVVVFVV